MELSAKRCKKARSLSLRDFVSKMEHKRKCFLGHRPDRDKPRPIKGSKSKREKKEEDTYEEIDRERKEAFKSLTRQSADVTSRR